MKRGRDTLAEDGDVNGSDTRRPYAAPVRVQFGEAAADLYIPTFIIHSIVEQIAAPVADGARRRGLLFFFDITVESSKGAECLIRISARSHAEKELLAHGNAPCPFHGPFWCSCGPMRFAAEELLLMLTSLLGFPSDYPIQLVADQDCPAPHIVLDSASRQWAVRVVGTTLPPYTLGPFKLTPMEDIGAALRHWNQSTFTRADRSNCCAQCGSGPQSFCTLCRCWLCEKCYESCDKCGRRTCRACCTLAEPSVNVCFSCLRQET